MSKLISVIVPVYKTEKNLHRCVDSILNQTYKNLEIILVDDGSPDNCPQICDEYAAKDNRVKVIHQQNGGQARARNVGLDIATGNYIGFVDSDDSIAEDMFEYLVKVAEEYNADIVKSGIIEVVGTKTSKKVFRNEVYETDTLGGLFNKCHGGMRWSVIWNGLYRRELLKDIRVPIGFFNEDNYFSSLAVFRARKIVTVDKCFYSYYFNESGTMANMSKRPLDRVFTRSLLKKEIEKFDFHSKTLDRAIAVDLCHYICRKNQFVRPCVIHHSLLKYLFENLDFRRRWMLRYWMWKRNIWIQSMRDG